MKRLILTCTYPKYKTIEISVQSTKCGFPIERSGKAITFPSN